MEVVVIREEADIAEARRVSRKIAQDNGLDNNDVERAAIIVTEAASNILKHARQGKILIYSRQVGIEFLMLDQGPGIANLTMAMQDGFSTAGSKGIGLGAMSRLSTEFDIYSHAGKGTAIWINLTAAPAAPILTWELGLPKAEESVNGDATAFSPACDLFLHVDGLGHGPEAHQAAQEAVKVFNDHLDEVPLVLINRIHLALRKTRGAAAAIAHIDRANQRVRFAGIGNIHAVLHYPGKSQIMVSMNGTLGHQIRNFQEFTYQWQGTRPLLIMHSDGLNSRWSLDDYPGLSWKPLPLIAGVLYRDFNRDYDDVSVLTALLQ